jgi:hypothetical protein
LENRLKTQEKKNEKVRGWTMDDGAQAIRAGKLIGRHHMAEDRKLEVVTIGK